MKFVCFCFDSDSSSSNLLVIFRLLPLVSFCSTLELVLAAGFEWSIAECFKTLPITLATLWCSSVSFSFFFWSSLICLSFSNLLLRERYIKYISKLICLPREGDDYLQLPIEAVYYIAPLLHLYIQTNRSTCILCVTLGLTFERNLHLLCFSVMLYKDNVVEAYANKCGWMCITFKE